VNLLAQKHDIDWFEANMIARVPARYKGAGRLVYPGFMQLTSFMSMNLDRHFGANLRQFRALMMDDVEASHAHRKFYDEYLAVMDLTAEFYLETVKRVFQDHELPRGVLSWRGRKVQPQTIRRTALLTVEAERDDICAKGQTSAAIDLCSGLPRAMKRHYLQEGVGHYGVFAGRRWETGIYPAIRDMIATVSPSA
jgi:poly(3-hydroxybutyrate) depolymerase